MIRRLDHVAIVVRDTEAALSQFRDRLGLAVVAVDEPPGVSVRLTYLDVGNTYLQLVEPLGRSSHMWHWLEEHGEGLHHICFGVDDVSRELAALTQETLGSLSSGRGRPAGFLPDELAGVRIECTSFDHAVDVEQTKGYLPSDDGRLGR